MDRSHLLVGTTAPSGEGALLAGLRNGDDSAFESLVRRQGGRMLSVARRMVGNEEDARDVVQEAFVSAFRALPRFNGDAQLGTWLHRIVVNTALMRLRSRRRRPEEPIESLLPSFRRMGIIGRSFGPGSNPRIRPSTGASSKRWCADVSTSCPSPIARSCS